MSVAGSDPVELEALARRLQQIASEMESERSRLETFLHDTWWSGADGDRFRGDWDGQYSPSMVRLVTRLRSTADEALGAAARQRRASGF